MDQFRMPLIGEKAPEFQADTSMGPVHFPADFRGRWVVFFSHPGDLPRRSAQAEKRAGILRNPAR